MNYDKHDMLRAIAKDIHTIAEDVRARWRAQAAQRAADEKYYAEWRAAQEAIQARHVAEHEARVRHEQEQRERSFWARAKRLLADLTHE